MRFLKSPLNLLLAVLFTFILNVNTGHAQHYLAFTPNGFSGWPDSIQADTNNIPVGGYLKNYSPDSIFHDSLRIDGYIDTGAALVPFSISFYNLYQTFQLAPGDSGFLILPFIFSTGSMGGQFHVGNNVVVVWPISVGPGGFSPGDSLELNVFIIDTLNSIGHEYPPSNVRIYPVPSNGPLWVNSYHPQYQVTSIIIYDAMGQEMYRSENPSGPIDTQTWAPGLYTIETTLSNGSVSYYKILRQ